MASTLPWPARTADALGVPNLSDIVYAYPEIRILAHEPSLAERGLMNQSLIERVELVDEDEFMEQIRAADCIIMLMIR